MKSAKDAFVKVVDTMLSTTLTTFFLEDSRLYRNFAL